MLRILDTTNACRDAYRRRSRWVWARFAIVAAIALYVSNSDAAEARPNVVVFIGDNWAWPHAGALGDPVAKTPVFDRIAREGVLFNHAFCPVPSCAPTRSSILTGRAAHQLEDAASLCSAFKKKHKVFTDTLREAGYEVGYSGKGWAPGRYTQYGWKQNPVGKEYKSLGAFLAQRDKSKPFFFWVGNTDTARHSWRHDQLAKPGRDTDAVRVPPQLPDDPVVRNSMLAYYGGVGRMDAHAGRCVAELERRGLFADAIFMYTSDNGWQFPRGLANCYDAGTRLPMAVRWGDKLNAGRRVEEFVSLTDLAPTFLEIAGVSRPEQMTGRSFLDVLTGKPSAFTRDHVFVERERHANVRRGNLSYPIRGIRTKEFLYLWNMRPDRWPAGDPKAYFAVGDYGDVDETLAKYFVVSNATKDSFKKHFDLSFAKRPAEELYDLRNDPHQLVNVAVQPEYTEATKKLRARVERWMRDTNDPRVDPDYDAWDNYPYFGPRVVDKNGKPIPKRNPRNKKNRN